MIVPPIAGNRWLLSLLALCLAAGCAQSVPAPPAAADASADSARALLAAARTDTLRTAFGRLRHAPHLRTTRTEQLGADGRPLASDLHPTSLPAGRTLQHRTAGRFDYGALARFSDDPGPAAPPDSLAGFTLPDPAALLSSRNRPYYAFALLPDSTAGPHRFRRLTVSRRDVPHAPVGLLHARYTLDAATRQIVALEVEQISPSKLFREWSRSALALAPASNGAWLPARTAIESRTSMLLLPERHFRAESLYRFRPPSPPADSRLPFSSGALPQPAHPSAPRRQRHSRTALHPLPPVLLLTL